LVPVDQRNSDAPVQRNSPKIFAISGIGGAGKTEVAAEYVWTRKNNFDAIFWFDAQDKTQMPATYQKIAIELGLELPDSVDSRDYTVCREKVKGWFSNPLDTLNPGDASKSANWLVVFDDAKYEISEMWDFFPQDGLGCVLITTRIPRFTVGYGDEGGLVLGSLPNAEAVEMLERLTRTSLTEQQAALEIVQALDCMPSLILPVSELITRKELSFGEFLEIWKEEEVRDDIYTQEFMQFRAGHQRTSFASLLDLDSLSSTVVAVLSLVVFLNTDQMQERLFWMIDEEGPDVNLPMTRSAYLDARGELLRASIATRNFETNSLSVTSCTRNVMGMTLRKRGTYMGLLAATIRRVYLSLPAKEHPGAEYSEGQDAKSAAAGELFPHLEVILQTFESLNVEQKRQVATTELSELFTFASL
jgi:hypothetical protein